MKKINLKKYVDFVYLALLVISFACLFFTCGVYKYMGNIDYKFNGFQMIFGYKDNGYSILKFNFFGLLMLLLLIVCGVLLFIKYKNVKHKYFIFLASCCLTSLLYFLLPVTVNHATSNMNKLFSGCFAVFFGASVVLITGLLPIVDLLIHKKDK